MHYCTLIYVELSTIVTCSLPLPQFCWFLPLAFNLGRCQQVLLPPHSPIPPSDCPDPAKHPAGSVIKMLSTFQGQAHADHLWTQNLYMRHHSINHFPLEKLALNISYHLASFKTQDGHYRSSSKRAVQKLKIYPSLFLYPLHLFFQSILTGQKDRIPNTHVCAFLHTQRRYADTLICICKSALCVYKSYAHLMHSMDSWRIYMLLKILHNLLSQKSCLSIPGLLLQQMTWQRHSTLTTMRH